MERAKRLLIKTRYRYLIAGILLCVLVIAIFVFRNQARLAMSRARYQPQTRVYYMAAEDVIWDFAPGGKDPMTEAAVPAPWGTKTKYQKTRYIEYTDNTFTIKKNQPEWLGILGPVLRGVTGDTIKVVFKNASSQPYSVHPHGVGYTPANEGAMMAMEDEAAEMLAMGQTGTTTNSPSQGSGSPIRAGNSVLPGTVYTYTWEVRPEAGPKNGAGSRVWLYHSHVGAEDINRGLVGAIVISDPGHAGTNGLPNDVLNEYVSLYYVFDESTPNMDEFETEGSMKHSINGYIFNNLEGYQSVVGHTTRWHMLAVGNEIDLHTPHWHGNVVFDNLSTTDVVELLPASMRTVDMIPDQPGRWMYHCHVTDHMEAGMTTMYNVSPH